MRKTTKLGLFRTKKEAIKSAGNRRKNSSNDISPNFTTFYKVEKTKKPKNPKKPSYYVVMTQRKKSKLSIERSRKNRKK
tara:strand:- start:330 stop:566 length:237 start_codon:yes stop_codon:yes gene_type:complete